jgi:predicted nuclease with TOPRIM domain
VDHNEQTTTWVDPRTYHLRKHDIREIVPGELPYAWEEAFDKTFGVYYIDHSTQAHFIDAPWEDHVREQVLAYNGQGDDAQLQEQLQKEREMKDELDMAQANLEQLANEKDRLENELSTFQRSGDAAQIANIESDLQNVSERIEQEQAEVDRVAVEYARLQQEIEEFQNRLVELSAVNARLETENEGFMQDATDANANLEEMRAMIETEAAQRNALESYIKQLKTEVLQLYNPDDAGAVEDNEHLVMDAPLPVVGSMSPAQEMAHLKSRLEGERHERERLRELTETLEAERIKVQESDVC